MGLSPRKQLKIFLQGQKYLVKQQLLDIKSKNLVMQNIKLQVLWLDDSLGLALNQETGNGTCPLTPYYFWPVSEAWEQIRFELDSKPWVPEEERVQLLNLVVDVMNKWQQSRMELGKKADQNSDIKFLTNAEIVGAR